MLLHSYKFFLELCKFLKNFDWVPIVKLANWNKFIFNLKGGDFHIANTYYSTEFKKMAVELVNIANESTIGTAKRLNVPLKTLEKWITAYNKNPKAFDSDYISPEEQIRTLKKRISELETTNDILKKTLGFYIKKSA